MVYRGLSSFLYDQYRVGLLLLTYVDTQSAVLISVRSQELGVRNDFIGGQDILIHVDNS